MSRSLYVLPFDHRESFETGLFGWSGVLTEERTAQIAAAKQLIYDAALEAIRNGVAFECAAILVDEQFSKMLASNPISGKSKGSIGERTASPSERSRVATAART